MLTYEDRMARMKIPGDEDAQLRLAIAYAKRLRSESKKAPMLDQKLELQAKVKQAEGVVRQIRSNIFELGDMLAVRG